MVVFWSPIAAVTAKISKNPIRKCMNEPASSTTQRCQGGLARNVRGSSSGLTSSRLLIPAMSTKPPSGSALIPYSVSPRLRDQTVLPKPTKNLMAFMPKALAVNRCPASCSMIEISSAITKISTPSRYVI